MFLSNLFSPALSFFIFSSSKLFICAVSSNDWNLFKFVLGEILNNSIWFVFLMLFKKLKLFEKFEKRLVLEGKLLLTFSLIIKNLFLEKKINQNWRKKYLFKIFRILFILFIRNVFIRHNQTFNVSPSYLQINFFILNFQIFFN